MSILVTANEGVVATNGQVGHWSNHWVGGNGIGNTTSELHILQIYPQLAIVSQLRFSMVCIHLPTFHVILALPMGAAWVNSK